jgi:alkylhydroperoxidase family enzyme
MRIDCLAAWREAGDLFDERERAALARTESVSPISETHVPDEEFEKVRLHFSEREIADLTLYVATINVWSQLTGAFRSDPRASKRPPPNRPPT